MKNFSQLVKEVEFPKGYAKDIADLQGGETFPNTSEDPENFVEKAPKPKVPKGYGVGDKPAISEAAEIREQIYRLFEEIDEALDPIVEHSSATALNFIVEQLEGARDRLYGIDPAVVKEEVIDESFKGGQEIALKDGSKFTLTTEQAADLNKMFEKSSSRSVMEKTMYRNKKEFGAILEFAKAIHEEEQLAEAAIQRDLHDKKKVIVSGVKGAKSRPFTKKFANYAAYEKWADSEEAGDYDIQHVYNESELPEGTVITEEEITEAVKPLKGSVTWKYDRAVKRAATMRKKAEK